MTLQQLKKQRRYSIELQDNTLLHETVDLNDTTKLQQLMPFVKKKIYNINFPDADWNCLTPLHVACMNGNIKCCQILLEHGADFNSKTAYGKTPAHYASESGHLEILQILFYFGANLSAKDNFNENPIDLAKKYKHVRCEEFIKRAACFVQEMKEVDEFLFD